jgi:hypothetical protein
VRRVPPLSCDRRHALEIFGRQPVEERYAAQAEHALDDAEVHSRVGHRTSCGRLGERSLRQRADPRIGVVLQQRYGIGAGGCGRIAVEQAGQRSAKARVAECVDRLDRLCPHLRIGGAERSADRSIRLRRTERGDGRQDVSLRLELALLQRKPE